MDIIDAIKTRRSIRKYLIKKDVQDELIFELIDIAKYAPSAGNVQNWRIIVVKDKSKRDKISRICDQLWMNTAPVHLVICNDLTKIGELYGKIGREKYSRQDCAYFTQNILLAAHALGLGTCVVGHFDDLSMKNLLDIPDNALPECVITLGYIDSPPAKPTNRKRIELFLYLEKYGNTGGRSMTPFPLITKAKQIISKIKK